MGRLATQPRPPRPADIAIASSRMLTGLLRKIWKLSFQPLAPHNMGTSLVLMMLSFRIAVATADGDPHTITSLAKLVDMPAATVRRRVFDLITHHRVKMLASRKRGLGHEQIVVFDLCRLDRLMTLDHTDCCIGLIETSLNEMKRLRELLHQELVANGKQAAE
jgi:hypothetical protein